MEAATYHMRCRKGQTFSKSLTWKPDGTNVADLTGYTGSFLIKKSPVSGSTVLATLTVGSGLTVAATSPNIVVSVSGATTENWTPGRYLYYLELVSGGGIVYPLLTGEFMVEEWQ